MAQCETQNLPLLPFLTYRPDSEAGAKETDPSQTASLCFQNTWDAMLFGRITLKQIQLSTLADRKIYPGGMSFGLRMQTRGILVVGISDIHTGDGFCNPASTAGLRVRDLILRINGKELQNAKELTEAIGACQGHAIDLTVRRGNETLQLRLSPALDSESGQYKAGLWVRDSTAGIGTVTFLCEDGSFGGLGHGIYDVDTGLLLPLQSGTVTGVSISGIHRGLAGTPGALIGIFDEGQTGRLLMNTESGVYGILDTLPQGIDQPLSVGLSSELHTGEATLRCTLSGKEPDCYRICIRQINRSDDTLKNFVIEVTDERLLAATGGIVQGMSGSPIIQDGKLVGAVTHVLINDPTRGYGIFLENMLRNLP